MTLFFLTNTRESFGIAGKESGKYHLLLMLLRTFGASLASTALRHCITIRWLSVGSATDGILLKTDFAFELPDIPDRKVSPPGFQSLSSLPSVQLRLWRTGINFLIFCW